MDYTFSFWPRAGSGRATPFASKSVCEGPDHARMTAKEAAISSPLDIELVEIVSADGTINELWIWRDDSWRRDDKNPAGRDA